MNHVRCTVHCTYPIHHIRRAYRLCVMDGKSWRLLPPKCESLQSCWVCSVASAGSRTIFDHVFVRFNQNLRNLSVQKFGYCFLLLVCTLFCLALPKLWAVLIQMTIVSIMHIHEAAAATTTATTTEKNHDVVMTLRNICYLQVWFFVSVTCISIFNMQREKKKTCRRCCVLA